jgi:hypothetical protein
MKKIYSVVVFGVFSSLLFASYVFASPVVDIDGIDYSYSNYPNFDKNGSISSYSSYTGYTLQGNNGKLVNGSSLPDANTKYSFINRSDGSWDSGANQVNIVDYILEGRLNKNGPDNNTYTLVNGPGSLNNITAWDAAGVQSFIVDEIAGNANLNTFGYYDESTVNGQSVVNRTEICTGPDSNVTNGIANPTSDMFTSVQDVGFYLGAPSGDYYYTNSTLNPNKAIQAAIFQVNNSNTYIIGFEDLRYASSDDDYQDMIVSVTIDPAHTPTPEPGTMLLVGAGLMGATWIRRKNWAKRC